MNEEDYEDTSVCPRCCEEVLDEEIYSCEVCGKLTCKLCINDHMKKHKEEDNDD